jgi:signal peptidase I
MNNPRKLILLNVSVTLIAFLIWMVTSGVDVITVYGATKPIPFTYDRGVFNITDLSIKEGNYSTDIIGFVQNVDPSLRTIKGVKLKIEMYDRNNHLIDVAESGYSSLPATFAPQAKYAFKIPIDKNNDLDHLHIQILAQDWGTSTSCTYPNENVSALGNNSSDYSSLVIRCKDMEPHLKPNDIVTYSNSTSFNNLESGDVIVFRAPEAKTLDGKPKIIVHRISDIGTFFEKKVVKTKGDANPYSIPGIDFPIFKENYIGKVVSVTHNSNTTTITESKETETNETKEFQNIMKRMIQDRLGISVEDFQSQIIDQDPNNIMIYLCIQVDKNSIDRVCKYWSGQELSPMLITFMGENEELGNLLKQITNDALRKGFNNSIIEIPEIK